MIYGMRFASAPIILLALLFIVRPDLISFTVILTTDSHISAVGSRQPPQKVTI